MQAPCNPYKGGTSVLSVGVLHSAWYGGSLVLGGP